MLPYIGDFATAIKQQARDINVVIAYKNGDNYVFLQKDKLQSLTYNAKVEKGLGGVVRKVADIKAMYNEYTTNLTKGMAINLYYKCGDGMCKKALLYISQVKINKISKIISIEALDYLSYIEGIATLPMMKNTDLLTYEKTVFNQLGYNYTIDSSVVNPRLTLGYPVSSKLLETFEEMAEANQAVFDFGFNSTYELKLPFELPATFSLPLTDGYITPSDTFEVHVKKFGFSNPVDTLDIGTELINFELDDDSSDQYNDVKVSLFFPSSSEQKSLGKVTATIPGSVVNYNIGTIDFGNTMIPQVCIFDDMVDVADYTIGSDSFGFSVNNSGVLAKNIEAEMYGLDISTATLKNTDTDSNIKQVSNMYIQSATVYDTEIYKHPNCTLKTFGNPLYEVGDTIAIDVYDVLILEENLVFNGGLKCTLKGVAKDNEAY
ncbi:hypothetical protein QTL86_12730 [Cellulosilyticum sp. ST5]|uniref:hypothetical protein n=1 Tax=Cellulosilyticum sp. ST5 TaxID=3055805 RepID=UPI003977C654